jgi:predicted molibdopterin-dependent oxidoreductase YjgC
MVDAAGEGRLDVLVSAGGNFLEVLPDPKRTESALRRIPLRVHIDIVLSSQMLVEPDESVVVLPAATRYEIAGGVTETSTERRVILSPEIPGPRIGTARPEWEVFLDIARRVRPELADRLRFIGTAEIREEIARCVPAYAEMASLKRGGDSFQWGGAMLCAGWRFPTADGKAHFSMVRLPQRDVPPGLFRLATRRGKQFNSMVQGRRDPLNSAGRDAVLVAAEDAARLGIRDGDRLVLRSQHGQLGGRVQIAPIAAGNVQVYWPEAEVLLDADRRSPEAGIPDFNTLVSIELPA